MICGPNSGDCSLAAPAFVSTTAAHSSHHARLSATDDRGPSIACGACSVHYLSIDRLIEINLVLSISLFARVHEFRKKCAAASEMVSLSLCLQDGLFTASQFYRAAFKIEPIAAARVGLCVFCTVSTCQQASKHHQQASKPFEAPIPSLSN